MDPVNPQDDPALIAKIAAMTDTEFAAVVDKARGDDKTRDMRKLIAHINGTTTD
jgi:hypothetical protein